MRNLVKRLIAVPIVGAALFFPNNSQSQDTKLEERVAQTEFVIPPQIEWERTFGDGSIRHIEVSNENESEFYYATGSSTIKVNQYGELVWENPEVSGKKILVDADGRVVVLGPNINYFDDSIEESDVALTFLNPETGETTGIPKTFHERYEDFGSDFYQDENSGNFNIVGETREFYEQSDILFIETDSEGNEINREIIGGPTSDEHGFSIIPSVMPSLEDGKTISGYLKQGDGNSKLYMI